MKLCFSTLGCHDLPLTEILKLALKYDVSAIEVRGIDNEMSNDRISDLMEGQVGKTKAALKQAGVLPLILGTSCKFHDELMAEKNIEKAKTEIDIAQRAGFKAIRVFGNNIIDSEKECIQRVAKALDEVCAYAKNKDVQVYLEVHGDFNTVERLSLLIEQMEQKENFGLIWDIYHTHAVYGKQWRVFYEAMKPWIQHVHIKDSIGRKLTLPNEGELEIIPIIKHLIHDGYTGWFSLEWERKWEPELPTLDTALTCLCDLLKASEIDIEKERTGWFR